MWGGSDDWEYVFEPEAVKGPEVGLVKPSAPEMRPEVALMNGNTTMDIMDGETRGRHFKS